MFDSKSKIALRRRLLTWFDKNQRDLPWRKNKTPYRIWVSEIMLQQTQVATVIDYYRRFLERFPNVSRLAAASESDALKMWEGLGYYRRARQMHAAAKAIVDQHGGKFPSDFEEVLALPGVGRYTAGAILSISLDHRLPILEGNTIRLFARLLAMEADPRSSNNQNVLWDFSRSLLPRKRCGDFNQALMELGSQICTPREPACDRCPLMNLCPAFLHRLQDRIPVAAKKMNYEDINEAVVLVARNVRGQRKFLVRLCGPGERWEGLWDFPRYVINQQRPKKLTADDANGWEVNRLRHLESKLKSQFGLTATIRATNHRIKHAVTRFRIQLDCFRAETVKGRLKSADTEVAWKTQQELDDLAMSVTGRKIARQINKGTQLLMHP